MTRLLKLTILTLALAVTATATAADRYEENWDSLKQWDVPEWFRDVKLGIFIHWGPYSVPAYRSEWYPRHMYMDEKVWNAQGEEVTMDRGHEPTHVYKHHVREWGPLERFGYKDFIPMFQAPKFDAEAWVDLFVKSGARYVVPVAEHHDGFAMYDSKVTRWNSVDMGPKRDIVGELREATLDRGLKFGVSSHFAFNWAYYNKKPGWDTADPEYRDLYGWNNDPMGTVDDEFLELWWARTKDMIDQYEPDLIWFDFFFDRDEFRPYHKKLAAYYYNSALDWDKGVVLQGKNFNDYESFPPGSFVLDLERGKMSGISEEPWQTDTSIGKNSWAFIHNWDSKTPNTVVDNLIDIVAKNGCLLLNVGPKADGTIPADQKAVLLEMGLWLQMNGDAIYETRPWEIYGEGPTQSAQGHHTEARNKTLTSEDIRFTRNSDTIYAIVMAWPEDGEVDIEALGRKSKYLDGEIESVELIGANEDIRWKQNRNALNVEFPDIRYSDFAWVLRIN